MKKRKSQGDVPAPRRGRVRAVADMLPEIGGTAFRRFGFVQSSIVSRWREIVGVRYAGVSTPESIRFPMGARRDGVLTLLVEGAHAPMMQHIAPEIMTRVNRFFGYDAVARMVIRQGAVAPPRTPRPAPSGLRPISAELGESLRGIADAELRECLAALAGAVVASEGAPLFEEDAPWR